MTGGGGVVQLTQGPVSPPQLQLASCTGEWSPREHAHVRADDPQGF